MAKSKSPVISVTPIDNEAVVTVEEPEELVLEIPIPVEDDGGFPWVRVSESQRVRHTNQPWVYEHELVFLNTNSWKEILLDTITALAKASLARTGAKESLPAFRNNESKVTVRVTIE